MRIFHAAPKDLGRAVEVGNGLLTYAEAHGQWARHFHEWAFGSRARALMLDSGAHGVAAGTSEVRLDDYCTFLEAHGSKFFTYVQLDVVGDAAATRDNLARMEARGLTPLPVYTARAPLAHLEALCERYGYIGLGGLKGREQATVPWRIAKLDAIFSVVARHWPVRLHAFGIVAQEILERYPFYSSDSATAVLASGNGRVLVCTLGQWTQVDCRDAGRMLGDADVASVASGARASVGYLARMRTNYAAMMALETHVTRLWASRGVEWKEDEA